MSGTPIHVVPLADVITIVQSLSTTSSLRPPTTTAVPAAAATPVTAAPMAREPSRVSIVSVIVFFMVVFAAIRLLMSVLVSLFESQGSVESTDPLVGPALTRHQQQHAAWPSKVVGFRSFIGPSALEQRSRVECRQVGGLAAKDELRTAIAESVGTELRSILQAMLVPASATATASPSPSTSVSAPAPVPSSTSEADVADVQVEAAAQAEAPMIVTPVLAGGVTC